MRLKWWLLVCFLWTAVAADAMVASDVWLMGHPLAHAPAVGCSARTSLHPPALLTPLRRPRYRIGPGQPLPPQDTLQRDSQLVDVRFRFQDGVYSQVGDLCNNQPRIAFKHLGGQIVLQEAAYLLKVENLYPIGRPDMPLPLDSVAAIAVNGLPYIKVRTDTVHGFTVFAGLRVKGRLSYFSYTENTQDTVVIKAYNPVTKRPFRQKPIVRQQQAQVETIVNITTGQRWPFTVPGLLAAIADDTALVKTLTQLPPQEARTRLEKTLLIYDDRHPLRLPVGEW